LESRFFSVFTVYFPPRSQSGVMPPHSKFFSDVRMNAITFIVIRVFIFCVAKYLFHFSKFLGAA
jgi:hypothetical protein